MKISIELSQEEADTLARLIDSAVKAEGLPAAVAAVPIFLRLKEAAAKAETDDKPGMANV